MLPEAENKLIGLGVSLPALATVFVGFRFWARRKRHTRFGIDDYIIIPALALVWGMGITQIIGSTVGDLGEPVVVMPNGEPLIDQRTKVFKMNEYAFQVIEKLAFGLIKLSILFFYRRIFVGKVFNIVSWTMIAIISSWSLSFFLATVAECNPPSLQWSPSREVQLTQCVKTVHLLVGFAWSDLVTDVIILSLPIPGVMALHLPFRRRIALLGVFLLGGLTVLAGVARLISFYKAAAGHLSPQIGINGAPPIYWSLIEAGLAIIAACLPTLRPLFHGLSLKSIISTINKWSPRKTSNDRSKRSGTSKYIKAREDTSNSSQVCFNPKDGIFVGGKKDDVESAGKTRTEIQGVHLQDLPSAHLRDFPEDGIMVSKTFGQHEFQA